MKKRIAVQGSLVSSAVILSVLLFRFMISAENIFLDSAGAALIFLGFLFRIMARGYKSDNSNNGEVLVRTGPYSLVRNPMYLGTFLVGAGIIVLLFKWWVFFIFLAFFLIIYVPQVKKEEIHLISRFGAEYSEYCRMTPRFFPKPAQLLKRDPKSYMVFKRIWAKKELVSMALTILVVTAAEIWRVFSH